MSLVLATAMTPAVCASPRLFPPRETVPALLAAPREAVTKSQLVYANPNPAAYGPGPAGEVAVSVTAAVVRLGGDLLNPLVIGLEGATFARFSFAVVTRELVNTDWVFGVPVVWWHNGHWLRFRYYHTSSHLGDEYQQRFGTEALNFSRDGIDLTAYLRPSRGWLERWGAGVYVGTLWSLNSHPEEKVVRRVRAGLEIDPSGGERWKPYGAVDVELEEGSRRGARVTGQLGIWLPQVEGRPLRLAVELLQGPSAMGQFSTKSTRRMAVGLLWNP
ncbi:MAG: DUF1207 domain-containing protein [Gemmatimonadetes bacterium]|nr:DUF1207 domain-containing protein [Gemmatimonadota bacterium]MBT4609020.1 DUF1207 domain-containing protein [Gemmatimonadota bacterium]MBT5145197.1 DUF1207 domain-containing protein [Gemmatimonadota bacterium]MBT6628432.1 DUF1207 domain-containing protein [Gemmatimonadota bacterium]MBT7453322.1 DUF1207 domain-containing protein [Gemmatimonadota bacterium]